MVTMTAQQLDDQFGKKGVSLDLAGFEHDLTNHNRARISWERVCNACAANTQVLGPDVKQGWRPIVIAMYAAHGIDVSRDDTPEMLRIKNKQPVKGFAALMLQSFKIDPTSELAEKLVDAETKALDFGKQLTESGGGLEASDDGAVQISTQPAADAFVDYTAHELPPHEDDELVQEIDGQVVAIEEPEKQHVTRAHVPRHGEARRAVAHIVGAGPNVNPFREIHRVIDHCRTR